MSPWGPLTPWLSVRFRPGSRKPKMRELQERETGVFPPHFLLGLATLFSFVYLGGGCSPRLNHLPTASFPADGSSSPWVALTILSFFSLFRSWVILTSCCVESSHFSIPLLSPYLLPTALWELASLQWLDSNPMSRMLFLAGTQTLTRIYW